ncbi:WbuC family cupin fold metalloprotein [Bacteroides thetaiotaomicron]|uniref:WbuC family cupin fold metalloprotein n=1 Tax=Bacteroides thetaiotaomicron TaxID=818 RepID=UPI00216443C8|nr:WbuC family cupin fold metalloprotein [Bacteroides thetaiotaomicron]UVS55298.1 WbuC family cupin fold metalloprotein [Bacteroides thetaiotaomicron]
MVNPRLRHSFDLCNPDNSGQCMLNILMLGTSVPIHRYPNSNENAILICGKLVEIIYDNEGNEKDRIHLNPTVGSFGCVVLTGAWHTVEVIEPSVIYEAKDGKYGEEGSETLDEYRAKLTGKTTDNKSFSNSLGDLKKKHRVSHWYGT